MLHRQRLGVCSVTPKRRASIRYCASKRNLPPQEHSAIGVSRIDMKVCKYNDHASRLTPAADAGRHRREVDLQCELIAGRAVRAWCLWYAGIGGSVIAALVGDQTG